MLLCVHWILQFLRVMSNVQVLKEKDDTLEKPEYVMELRIQVLKAMLA